jgi:hypothetical protein
VSGVKGVDKVPQEIQNQLNQAVEEIESPVEIRDKLS